MIKKLKKLIKKNKFLYSASLMFLNFYNAILNIKINFDSLREFYHQQIGSVSLGTGNYRLYQNIFPRLINKYGNNLDPIIIIDVGANNGWFAKVVYRFSGKNSSIISFEPLRSMHGDLENLQKKYPNYKYETCALGELMDEVEITEYHTAGLSSMKSLSSEYSYDKRYYDTSIVDKYLVKIIKLDDYLESKKISKSLILKIDTQGYEYEVLKGASRALKSGQIKVVIVEVMTIEKYDCSVLYKKIFDYLHEHEFTIFDIYPSYYEKDGTLSEFDCIFIKDLIKND